MIVTNSFSHTAEKPRFRVIIPTTQAVSAEVSWVLYENIAAKLEDAGYFVRGRWKRRKAGQPSAGLDWSKHAPNSLFYLPCQAKDPKQSFFIDHNNAGRSPLDPVIWIENGPIPLQPEFELWSPPADAEPRPVNQARVDRAIAEWRGTPKGHGNDTFFRLGLKRRRAGMDDWEIKGLLQREVEFAPAKSRKDRSAQIPHIIKSLSRYLTKSDAIFLLTEYKYLLTTHHQ